MVKIFIYSLLKHTSELVIFCTAVGAGLGLTGSMRIRGFYGDVGFISIGWVFGTIAVLVRQEFLLVIMGGVFVVETLSVILQVGSYQLQW